MPEPDPLPVWNLPALEELAGEFPKLEIKSLLATGGMGAVYLVRQQALDRLAVLKVLPLEAGADDEAAGRFQTEARALASVRDRGVVEVYDFGSTSGGYLYLLLEYEGGGDLRSWLRNRSQPVTPQEALGIGSAIAGGLAAAHRKGIIHGDIKPDNILLDEEGQVKVGDFGLAGTADLSTATHHTPGYTAPEILAGLRRTTPATDLYAVGATIFELLFKTTPPEDAGSLALQLGQLPEPSGRVIGWALQPDPAARPASAQEYRGALDAAVAELQRHALPQRKVVPLGLSASSRGTSKAASAAGRVPLPWWVTAAGLVAVLGIGYFVLKPSPPPADSIPAETVDFPSTPPAPETPSSPLPESFMAEVPPTPPLPELQTPAPAIAAVEPSVTQDQEDEAWLEEGTMAPGTAEESAPAPATPEEIAAWNPDWTVNAPTGNAAGAARFSISQAEEGRVLVLCPFSPGLPATLTRRLTLPSDGPMQLSVRVASANFDHADWVLKAFADDVLLSSPQIINNRAYAGRFLTLTWDLRAWQGKTVTLRLENADGGSRPSDHEFSYWSWVRVEPLGPLLAHAPADPKQASRTTPESGFVDLFSPQQLAGWKSAGDGGLSFKDGVATTFTRPGPHGEGVFWFSKRMFKDFILKADFKIESPRANSGLILRFPDPGSDPTAAIARGGIEIDICGYDDTKLGTGAIAWSKRPDSLPLKTGDWNTFEVAVTGARHLLKLNGTIINEWHGGKHAAGFIGLQFLQSDGEVSYRHLMIRELQPAPAPVIAPGGGNQPDPPAASRRRPLGIPADAMAFNGKWYRYYPGKMLWRMAKKRCEDLRGHLAYIPDEATHQFLTSLAGGQSFWAGASDEKREGEWLWLDGSPVAYSRWAQGQPDNSAGREDFLSVINDYWNDDSNEGHSRSVGGFICQWD